MKKAILTFALPLLSFFAGAQTLEEMGVQNFCGNEVLDGATKAWLNEYDDHPEKYDPPTTNTIDTLYIPVKVHLVGKDDCSGFLSKESFLTYFCRMNTRFNTGNPSVVWRFYLYGDVDYICKSSLYNNASISSSASIASGYVVPQVLNIFMVANPGGYCGYAPAGLGGILVNNSCVASFTMEHETGHYFGLPHTFDLVGSCYECADGSNCSSCGDRFCDTKADYFSSGASCGASAADKCTGSTFTPDGSMFMSYITCTNKVFSHMQQNAMVAYVKTYRAYLLNYKQPANGPLQGSPELVPPNLIAPANSASVSTVTNFSWSLVPGATMYRLRIKTGSVYALDTIVTATSVTANLVIGKTYQWSVQPQSGVQLCANYSAMNNCTVTTATGMSEEKQLMEQISIYPNPFPAGNAQFLSVNVQKNFIGKFLLRNAIGQIIQEADQAFDQGNNRIRMPSLSAGIYFLSIQCAEGVFQQKLIVLETSNW